MTLRYQTKKDWLVRCKRGHAEKETEAVYDRIQSESREGDA
jgi:hypothetical protein